ISHHAKILVGELGMQAGLVVLHGRGRARPGARCAYRMALDHPATVARLAVLDIVPTGAAFGRADMDFSLGFWGWACRAGPAPEPERRVARVRTDRPGQAGAEGRAV